MVNEIIKVERTDTGLEVRIKKGVAGGEVLNAITMLANVLFTNKDFKQITTEEQINLAFEDIKRMYKEDYLKEEVEQ